MEIRDMPIISDPIDWDTAIPKHKKKAPTRKPFIVEASTLLFDKGNWFTHGRYATLKQAEQAINDLSKSYKNQYGLFKWEFRIKPDHPPKTRRSAMP
jgi:hypothetical protein